MKIQDRINNLQSKIDFLKKRKEIIESDVKFDEKINLISKNIGKRIKSLRKSSDITHAELGEITGMTPHYFSFIENGKKSPNLRTIIKICIALDCKFSDIFKDDDF